MGPRSRRARLVGRLAFASLALALLAGATPAGAVAKGGGHKKLKYSVADFSYTGTGELNASRKTSGCVAGETAQWGGLASTVVDLELATGPELSPLQVGKAKLNLKGGAHGSIDIDLAPTTNHFNATHRITTACYLGFPVTEVDTRCGQPTATPEPGHVFEAQPDFNSSLLVHGDIVADGKRVEIYWMFQQGSGEDGFVSTRSDCHGEAFRFPGGSCTSHASLKKLKKKKVTLAYGDCETVVSSAPNTDSYLAVGHASGQLKLRRH